MMDEMYGLHPTIGDYSDKAALMSPANLMMSSDYHSLIMNSSGNTAAVRYGSDELISATCISESAASITPHHPLDDDISTTFIKAKIASHPHYPRLLQSYIDCHKVGAPPKIANILEDIKQSDIYRQDKRGVGGARTSLGVDPELDEFMETYCEILDKYKSDLSRPFDEATNFLNKIESQLRNLCKGAFVKSASAEEGAMSSDDDYSGGEIDVQDLQPKDEERDLKDQLLRRFGSHISSLKLEFSKKKKKGKLPREARQLLFDWWNAHYKWPYPTLNDLLSLGQHRVWKRMAVSWSGAKKGDNVLDICCGSGDIAFLLSEKVGLDGQVIGLDFSRDQLLIASSRQQERSTPCYKNIEWLEGDALNLPFLDESFDSITMGYGLRNVVDRERAIQEIIRVLKPGCKVSILDFNKSAQPITALIQEWMIDNVVVPVATGYGLAEEYKYLKSSIQEFLTGKELEQLALSNGFSDAKFYEIAGGLMGNLVATR